MATSVDYNRKGTLLDKFADAYKIIERFGC